MSRTYSISSLSGRGAALLFVFATAGVTQGVTFDDFSSLSYVPVTSGSLTDGGVTITFSGDSSSLSPISDGSNGSTNGIAMGDPTDFVEQLTLDFSPPVSEVLFEFDAMHRVQSDAVTTSDGTWTSFPSTLSLTGSTLTSTATVVNPGGSGIDDELFVTLSFAAPTSSVTLTNEGLWILDSITVVPEPTGVALLAIFGIGGFITRRRLN